MLVELRVENYAVIDRIRVRFHEGFNVLTGETGSGKSIVVDALSLLYGGRASSDMVRTGADRARVSGIFELPESPDLHRLLKESGVEAEDGELILEREILANGKSRAFAGSRAVTAAFLRQIAPLLGDIHGQHDQQMLFDAGSQLDMLDAFAATGAERGTVAGIFADWRAVSRELEELDRSEQDKLRLADLWSFQVKEIEGAGCRPGEDRELDGERNILRNVTRLHELASAAYESLYDSPEAALSRIGRARRRLDELNRIDPAMQEILALLGPAEAAVDEAARALQSYLGGLEADPARLDHVESRLATLEKLKRKYGATLDKVSAFLEDARANLQALEHSTERRAELEGRREALAAAYREAAGTLSERRREAAAGLEQQVQKELASLAMERTVFRVRFSSAEWSEHGFDRVGFLISPNVGEEPKPLDRIASGGELSRVALALKTCVAVKPPAGRAALSAIRTLVFDEVDAGIGGATAEAVGRRLKKLAASHQLLCVTHLAQIAGLAGHHYRVEKSESNGRTVSTIEELTGSERTREIARMFSGETTTAEALKHAEQLLRMAAD